MVIGKEKTLWYPGYNRTEVTPKLLETFSLVFSHATEILIVPLSRLSAPAGN